jgi:glyoxylase-like metal-dependent hydrolase (beta-lactamase superfamily II)
MDTVLPPLREGSPDGIRLITLPTPFRVGGVNCYLLLDPPVTVIDPGTKGSLEAVAAAGAAAGLGLQDVEQVIVTHAHADHFGAAATLAARSGARIVTGRAPRARRSRDATAHTRRVPRQSPALRRDEPGVRAAGSRTTVRRARRARGATSRPQL